MSKKMFAIKIPEKEKDAMDMVARETGQSLAALYYGGLRRDISRSLGVVLINHLNKGRHSQRSKDLTRTLSDSTGSFVMPKVIEDLIGLFAEPDIKKRFSGIFPGITITDKGFLLHEIRLKDLIESLGREYIEGSNNFENIDRVHVQEIVIDLLTHDYYRLTAEGSLGQLQDAWQERRGEIRLFEKALFERYEEKFANDLVEVVEVEVLEEVSVGRKGKEKGK